MLRMIVICAPSSWPDTTRQRLVSGACGVKYIWRASSTHSTHGLGLDQLGDNVDVERQALKFKKQHKIGTKQYFARVRHLKAASLWLSKGARFPTKLSAPFALHLERCEAPNVLARQSRPWSRARQKMSEFLKSIDLDATGPHAISMFAGKFFRWLDRNTILRNDLARRRRVAISRQASMTKGALDMPLKEWSTTMVRSPRLGRLSTPPNQFLRSRLKHEDALRSARKHF